MKNSLKVLLIGSKDDEEVCKKIQLSLPEVSNLCNKTNFFDLGKLSKFSLLNIGNDTGPMHLISKEGGQSFVFFTKFSNPQLCCPVGENISIFKFNDNNEEFYNEVLSRLKKKLSLWLMIDINSHLIYLK